MIYIPHIISWNITKRCNLHCSHCYLEAVNSEVSDELSLKECFRIIDEITLINPAPLLILTGGEPLLREGIFDISSYASKRGFFVVMGSNGSIIESRLAKEMLRNGIKGVGISLDSLNPEVHDSFRGVKGAWENTLRGIEVLRGVGLDFIIQTTATQENYEEIPSIVDYSFQLGAKAFNLFFLVCTGRAQGLTDITPIQYEDILYWLFNVQSQYAGRMMINAKCAPHYRRIGYEMNSHYSGVRTFAGGCPAGLYYCRISPEGDLTPCPYMPLKVGNLCDKNFVDLWENSWLLKDLRNAKLKGRCGICEFQSLCSGCRARAYSFSGNYLGEDPWCQYVPGKYGFKKISLEEEDTLGSEYGYGMIWDKDAKDYTERMPSFAKGVTIKGVEQLAKDKGHPEVTLKVMENYKKGKKDMGIKSGSERSRRIFTESKEQEGGGLLWTKEAKERMESMPSFARPMAKKAVEDYARDKGIKEITPQLLKEAFQELVPPMMRKFMKGEKG